MFLPPKFHPPPSRAPPTPTPASLPSPCPAQLSPGGRESPTSVGSALQLPALSHCLYAWVGDSPPHPLRSPGLLCFMENSPTDHPSLHLHGGYFCFSGLLPRSHRPAVPASAGPLGPHSASLDFLASVGPPPGPRPAPPFPGPPPSLRDVHPCSSLCGPLLRSPQTAPHVFCARGPHSTSFPLSPSSRGGTECPRGSLGPPAALAFKVLSLSLWSAPLSRRPFLCAGLLPVLVLVGFVDPGPPLWLLMAVLPFLCIFLRLRSPLPQLHGLLPRSPCLSVSVSCGRLCPRAARAGRWHGVVEEVARGVGPLSNAAPCPHQHSFLSSLT